MMRFFLAIFIAQSIQAMAVGELRFSFGGKTFSTQNAQAALQFKGDKARLTIAVKDVTERFLLVLTADVKRGDELKPLRLTNHDAELALSLRTQQGVLAVLPPIQLARPTADTYIERVEVETNEWEKRGDDAQSGNKPTRENALKMRRKVRTEYRRIKPRWLAMTREERERTGEGIIANRAFDDTFLTLTLFPVVEAGKVTFYNGSFSGSGRFAHSVSGSEIRQIQAGAFHVKVNYAP